MIAIVLVAVNKPSHMDTLRSVQSVVQDNMSIQWIILQSWDIYVLSIQGILVMVQLITNIIIITISMAILEKIIPFLCIHLRLIAQI